MKEKYYQIKDWVYEHPKKVYKYSMIIILISFLFTILQYIFFPPDFKPKLLVPNLYSQSEEYKLKDKNKEKEMEKIVKEMQMLKQKSEERTLDSKDSGRLKYLYTEYQNLKNGLQKN